MNCPNDIGPGTFLPGIFIANALRVRRHFYETRGVSRNRVANNRAREGGFFPKAPVGERRGASKLGKGGEGGGGGGSSTEFDENRFPSRGYLI